MDDREREKFSLALLSPISDFYFPTPKFAEGIIFSFSSPFSHRLLPLTHTHMLMLMWFFFFLISILFSFHVLFSSGNGRSSLDTMSSTVTQGEHQINVGREFCGNLCGVSIRTEKESYIEVETYGCK